MNANEVAILIRAKDEATKTFKDISESANKSFDEAEKSAGGFGKTLGDVSKVAGGFLAAGAISSAVDGFTGFIGGAVSAASDLGESLNAVNVVFKDSAQTILDWGKNNANQFGLSQREFNQMATPLGAMLKNTGMDMKDVAKNTISLTERAADMASVFNTDVGDALTAIQAALRGESDPIEKYGVSLNAAAVEARALADTGKDSAKALTDQEKAAARLSLLFEQTAAVAGDFRNTSDGLANSQRIQAARTEELQAKIGTKLIPVMLKINELKFALVQIIADKLIPAMDSLTKMVGPVLGVAFDALSALLKGAVASGFELLADVGGRVVGVIKTFVDYIKFTVSEGDALNDFLSNLPGPLQGIAKFLGDAVLGLKSFIDYMKFAWTEGDALNDFLEGVPAPVRNTALAFGTAAVALKEQLIPNVKDAQHYFALGFSGGQVGGELGTIQMAAFKVGQTFREDVIPATKEMAAFVAEQIAALVAHLDQHFARFPAYFNEEVKPALENIGRLIEFVVTHAVEFFQEHWPQIREIVSNEVEGIKILIELAVGIITRTLDIIIKLLQGDWAGAWNSTKELVALVWQGIGDLIQNRVEFILNVLSLLKDIGVAMVGGLLEGAASKLGELANWFFALPGRIASEIPNPLDVLYNIGKQIIQGLINGITSMIGSLVSSVGGAISSIPAAAKKILGIFSPSRVMFGLGERVAEGFALGITDGMKSMVIPEAGRMAASVPNTIAGSSSGVAASGVSGGGFAGGPVYNYTINVQALDGTSAAQIIMRELVKWERRGGIAPGTTRAVA